MRILKQKKNHGKGGIAGLFKKLIKEPEETEDEINNNKLMDIYNSRVTGNTINVDLNKQIEDTREIDTVKNNENISISENNNTSEGNNISESLNLSRNTMQLGEEIKQALDNMKASIEGVTLESAVSKGPISSNNSNSNNNTRQLDFNINEALRDKTVVLDSTKKVQIQETQVVPTVRETVSQETQKIDSISSVENSLKSVNAVSLEAVSLENEEETQIGKNEVQEENLEGTKISAEEISEKGIVEVNSDEKTLESTVPSLEAVENITSKILEMKMGKLDNTQMIDTAKVREAINNENSKITPEFADMYKKTFGVDANQIRKEKALEEKQLEEEREKLNISNDFVNAENTSIFENKENYTERINYKFIGIAFGTYIIIEFNNEMYIIDQHAAHERIMYEKVKANYYSDDQKDSQFLLLPDIITVSFKQMSIARENVALFEKAGFAFEEFGQNTLKLTAVPSMCEDLNTKQLFLEILDEIDTVAVNEIKEKEEKFISTVACKSAVKAKMRLDEKEVDSLIQSLLSIENPFTCPHGRPTAIKMSKTDIEKKFARRK